MDVENAHTPSSQYKYFKRRLPIFKRNVIGLQRVYLYEITVETSNQITKKNRRAVKSLNKNN